jgi:hypothetical protein
MIQVKCEKCEYTYNVDEIHAGKSIRCKQCGDITTVPFSPGMSFGYFSNVQYKADGMTPDFDELFAALAHEELTAPPLISC